MVAIIDGAGFGLTTSSAETLGGQGGRGGVAPPAGNNARKDDSLLLFLSY